MRTLVKDGEPYFVAKDVADVLGYSDTRKATELHCKGGVKHPVLTNGGTQALTIIPERDVYRLVMRSKLPSAERFEEWVVGEVLPSIRKTGGYVQAVAPSHNLPQNYLEALEGMVSSLKANAILIEDKTRLEPAYTFQ